MRERDIYIFIGQFLLPDTPITCVTNIRLNVILIYLFLPLH